jgi:glycosyltransferase 2 family protein
MKYLARILALAGLALAIALFAHEGAGVIVDLVIAAGPGLVAAGLFHFLPMIANARAWQRLLPAAQRPRMHIMTWAIWVRESVNGLLPVARVGGEIVAYRILRRHVALQSAAAASLVVDMALSILSQAGFALLGLGLLLAVTHTSVATTQLLLGVACMIPLGVGFVLAQRGGALSAVTRVLDRLFRGRLASVIDRSVRLEDAIRAVYQRRGDLGACFAWQLFGWLLGAGEIWLALYFLGQSRSVLDAIVIEALIQAISSAAFVVPGAIGVQEGGFLLIGAALGIDGTTALALAAARRLRDVIVFFPGLIAWQWAETRARSVKPENASESR